MLLPFTVCIRERKAQAERKADMSTVGQQRMQCVTMRTSLYLRDSLVTVEDRKPEGTECSTEHQYKAFLQEGKGVCSSVPQGVDELRKLP